MSRIWREVLGVCDRTVLERVEFDQDAGVVIAHVRPRRPKKRFCGVCGQPAAREDRGSGQRRRWRGLDLGTVQVLLEGDAPRVRCRQHGRVVARVPWARHAARHTRAFEDTVAWLVTQCSKTAVSQLLRIAWRTVGSVITRVVAEIDARVDRLAGLRRIGIDEISYKRGHRYLTVVVDHDSGRLVWAAAGRDRATVRAFFDDLGVDRSAQITHVSADGADWISGIVAERCPQAVRCLDPFHVVAWATEALDMVRRRVWNNAQGRVRGIGTPTAGHRRATGDAQRIARARVALWKDPDNLTNRQAEQIAWIAKTQPELHTAYLLKEGLRYAFQVKGEAGKDALDRWTSWAQRCRIPEFVELQQRIRRHRDTIDATLEHGLSQALIESTNTKLRLLHRIAFGFRSTANLIALGMLALGGYRPPLPGRSLA